jgi:ABC-type transport system substrate-binding protein
MITYLEEIGLNIEPVIVDGATYQAMRKDPAEDWNIKHAGGQPITSTEYLNAMGYDRTGEKWPGVEDPYYDAIAAAARVSDRDERAALIDEAYASLMDSVVDLWIGDELTVALYRDNISGVPTDDYEFNWYNMTLAAE